MPNRSLTMAAAATALIIWNTAARASEGVEAVAAPLLLPLEPMLVPIVDHGEMIGHLQLRASWQPNDEAARALAEKSLPQLRAALLEGAADHARVEAAPSQAVDPESLARRLQASAVRNGFKGALLVLETQARAG